MKTPMRWMVMLVLSLTALACNLTGRLRSATPEFTALETQARQTLEAQLTQAAPTETAAIAIPTATAAAATSTATVTTAATAIPPTAAAATLAPAPTTLVPAVVIPIPPVNPGPVWPPAPNPNPWPPAPNPNPNPWPPPPPAPRPVTGRIRFAAGGTSGQVDGQLNGGAIADWLVSAGRGQTMMVNVYSPANNVLLGVTGVADGTPLLRPAAGQTSFSGVLPATQDYRLTLVAPPGGSSYTLQVIIPARIQFAPGAISASIPGQLGGHETNFYLARAAGGQTMTVRILSPYNDIFLTIYGTTDGSPLVRSVMGQWEWSGVLPMTQDYMIQAVSTGGSAGYMLEITIQ